MSSIVNNVHKSKFRVKTNNFTKMFLVSLESFCLCSRFLTVSTEWGRTHDTSACFWIYKQHAQQYLALIKWSWEKKWRFLPLCTASELWKPCFWFFPLFFLTIYSLILKCCCHHAVFHGRRSTRAVIELTSNNWRAIRKDSYETLSEAFIAILSWEKFPR